MLGAALDRGTPRLLRHQEESVLGARALPALRRPPRRRDGRDHRRRWSTTTTTRCTTSWPAAGASSKASTTRTLRGALLQAAEDWCRLQGMTCIRGPLNFTTNDEVGTLIDGFDTPPMVMMTHNPRYYPRPDRSVRATSRRWTCSPGSTTSRRVWTRRRKSCTGCASKAMEKQGLRVRKIDMEQLRPGGASRSRRPTTARGRRTGASCR